MIQLQTGLLKFWLDWIESVAPFGEVLIFEILQGTAPFDLPTIDISILDQTFLLKILSLHFFKCITCAKATEALLIRIFCCGKLFTPGISCAETIECE